MSDYIVSARKYRPQNWHTVVGQKALVQTLKNAIIGNKLAHAYLFCGPRGVGKTTCARILAKTINCQHLTPEGEACDSCESCLSFNEQRSYNVYELDAASNNSVENIRDLIEQVQIPPQVGRYKVFIIDEVHMLTTQAFNAFLKTLEEPPSHAIFIMATTEKQKILPTIISRCQTYDFQRISASDIVEQLQYIARQEGVNYEPQALMEIARKADGGMRDALSVFDQIVSFTGGNVTRQATLDNLNILDYELFFQLTDDALLANIPAALMILDKVIRKGFDPQYFIGGWANHLRDLMVAQDPATLSLIEAGPEVAQRYQQQAVKCRPDFLYKGLQIAAECDFNYRNSRNKRLSVEIAIVKICQLNTQTQAQTPGTLPQTPPSNGGAYNAQPAQGRPIAAQGHPMPQQPVQQTTPLPRREGQGGESSGAPASRFAPRSGAMAGPRIASLRGAAPQQSVATTQVQQQIEMNEPVAEDALRRKWKEFTSTIPTEKLLCNVMVGCLPRLVEGTQYKVTLSSQAQFDILDSNRERIHHFLHAQLYNTHLRVQFEVDESSDSVAHRAFSPREKFQEMQQENEAPLKHLVEAFGLEFA